jgi:hypothetical protein
MRRRTAAIGSAAFFLVGPGVVVGLVPWLLTRWQVREPAPFWAPARVLGVALIVAGLAVAIQAFVRFVVEGFGTPLPVAAPERLVVAARTGTSATRCTWRCWRPSSARHSSWVSSVC